MSEQAKAVGVSDKSEGKGLILHWAFLTVLFLWP